jgi:hypothetical protein
MSPVLNLKCATNYNQFVSVYRNYTVVDCNGNRLVCEGAAGISKCKFGYHMGIDCSCCSYMDVEL